MKKLNKSLVAILLLFILFMTEIFAVGGIEPQKAEAHSSDYSEEDIVYYFSDSTPMLDGYYPSNINIIVDTKPLISSQSLLFLIKTGYFWRFVDASNAVAIIEFKATKIDPYILRDLFLCLQNQNCKVIFVSAYEYDESETQTFMEFVNGFMRCNKDKYGRFLDQSIIDMARRNLGYSLNGFSDWAEIWYNNDWGNIWANTCILLDGRFIDVVNKPTSVLYDTKHTLAYSTFLQRMILDIRYGPTEDDRSYFEFCMYHKIWQFYSDNYLAVRGVYSDYEVIGIEELIEIWDQDEFKYEDFVSEYGVEYQEYYQDVVWDYFAKGGDEFEGIFNEFSIGKFHILVHIPDSNLFWNIIDSEDIIDSEPIGNTCIYEFTNENKLFEIFENVQLYAMCIWSADSQFYHFLTVAQQNLENNNQVLPVYLWIVDPIRWGDGLKVVTLDTLFSDYGITDEYDERNLIDSLLSLLFDMLRG